MRNRKASVVAVAISLMCGCMSLEERLKSPDLQVRSEAEAELYRDTREAPVEERLLAIDKLTRKDLLFLIALTPVDGCESEGCKAAGKITTDDDCLRLALEASTVAVQESATKRILSQEHLQTVFCKSQVDSVKSIALDKMSVQYVNRLPYDLLLSKRWKDVENENVLAAIIADNRNGMSAQDRIKCVEKISGAECLCKILEEMSIHDNPEASAVVVKRLNDMGKLSAVKSEPLTAYICSRADLETRIMALESAKGTEVPLVVIKNSADTNVLIRACQLVDDAKKVGDIVLADGNIKKLNVYFKVYGTPSMLKDFIECHGEVITPEVEEIIKFRTQDAMVMSALENLKRRREAERVCASLLKGYQINLEKFKLIENMCAEMDPDVQGSICRKIMDKTDWLQDLSVSDEVCTLHKEKYKDWHRRYSYKDDGVVTLLHVRAMLVRMLSEKDQRAVMNRILSYSDWKEPCITCEDQDYRLGLTSGLSSQNIIRQLLCSKIVWRSEWEDSSSWISPKWGRTTRPGGSSYIGCENEFKGTLIGNASEESLVQIIEEYSLKKENVVAGYPDGFRAVMAKIKDHKNIEELVTFFDANKGKGRIGRSVLGIEYSNLISKLGKDAIHERYVKLIERQQKERLLTFEGFHPLMSPEDFIVVCKEKGVTPERDILSIGTYWESKYAKCLKFTRRQRYGLFEKEDHEFIVSFMNKYVYPLDGNTLADVAKNVLADDLKREYDGDEVWVVYKSMKHKTMLRFNEHTGKFIIREFTGE